MGKSKKRKSSKSSPEDKGIQQKRAAVENEVKNNTKMQPQIHNTTHGQTHALSPNPQFQPNGQNMYYGGPVYATPQQQTYSYTQDLNQGSPYNLPPPPSRSPINNINTSEQFSALIQRFDSLEKRLSQLDSIQSCVDKISSRLDKMDSKVANLERKINEIESSRAYDTSSIDEINKKQKEIDIMLKQVKSMEEKQAEQERDMRSEILDLRSRSMRDNLLFFGIPEEKGESDSMCVKKVLELIQNDCEVENAKSEIKLHRAHRIGRYNRDKTRPIVAKFAFYQDRETVRKCADKLQRPYGISQQFPREIVQKRKELYPLLKKARDEGKEAYISYDKLYINGRLHRVPVGGSGQQ